MSYRTGTPGRGSIFNFERISSESKDRNQFRIKNIIGNDKKNVRDGLSEGVFLSVTSVGMFFFSCVCPGSQCGVSTYFDIKILDETADEDSNENYFNVGNLDNNNIINENVNVLNNDREYGHNRNTKKIPKVIEYNNGEDSMRTFFDEGYVKIPNVINKVRIMNCLR